MESTKNPETATAEARRIQRINLSLPVKVEGCDGPSERWQEITRLRDLSAFGAGLALKRPVKRGRLIQLTLPMPRKMRCYDYLEAQYRIWAIVRRCVKLDGKPEDGQYLIGTAFIGKDPPDSYHSDPSTVYEVSDREDGGFWSIHHAERNPPESHLPKEDRRHNRYDIPTNVVLEVHDVDGHLIRREETVTENISLSGAAIFSAIDLEIGSFLIVRAPQYNATIRSVVRGKRIGPDGIPRLHVEFINGYLPLEGIE